MGMFKAGDYRVSVADISIPKLVGEGVRCVLLDRDNTCVPRDATVAPPEVRAWLDEAREAGLALCLVSNNFHSADVERSARELGCDVVHHAMKPFPFAVWRAIKKEGVAADEVVLVGDQVFTDVAAGNLAGVRTILVRPQSRRDLWYTHVFRIFERLALRGVTFASADVREGGQRRDGS